MKTDRDQLFAEAVACYRAGVQWWPTAEFEKLHAMPEQAKRYETDIWEEQITNWLDSLINEPVLTSLYIAKQALGFSEKVERLGQRDANRIAAIMSNLKYKQRRTTKARFWVKK